MPGYIVEPLIALSIVYVAAENLLFQPEFWRRAFLTFALGLVHGLGFASALRDIGLGRLPGGVTWPLLKFNLGVEIGQLCFAIVILPLIWRLQKSGLWDERVTSVGSIGVACVGGYWFVMRILSQFSA